MIDTGHRLIIIELMISIQLMMMWMMMIAITVGIVPIRLAIVMIDP